ncbi:hypothetical protein TNCV_486861 [Trichonephila clavipes]|nr:hypothetical protein TNCV_486861 [Trichonephila clavipes]
MTPKLALPYPNYHTLPTGGLSSLDRVSVHRCPTRRVFSGTVLELVTKPATIRYLYHSATAAPCSLGYHGNEAKGANQAVIFSLMRGPFIEDFHQCVTFGFYTAPWQEQLYTTLSLILMFLLPLVTLIVTYVTTFITIASKKFCNARKRGNRLVPGLGYMVDALKLPNQAPRVSGEPLQTCVDRRYPDETQHLFCGSILANR